MDSGGYLISPCSWYSLWWIVVDIWYAWLADGIEFLIGSSSQWNDYCSFVLGSAMGFWLSKIYQGQGNVYWGNFIQLWDGENYKGCGSIYIKISPRNFCILLGINTKPYVLASWKNILISVEMIWHTHMAPWRTPCIPGQEIAIFCNYTYLC